MLRLLSYLAGLAIFVGGAYWVWESSPQVRSFFDEHINTSSDFHTLEARYTADQLMQNNLKTLLKDKRYSFLEPTMNFYPYALLDVKYSLDQKTKEGILLWSLHDGELVLDTNTWETTHGFQDCINAKAEKHDFKVLKALAKSRSQTLDREHLLNELHVENETLDSWVDSCRQKKLVVQRGNEYRLHFSDPKLSTVPETKNDQWLVTKPYINAHCMPKKYSVSQIENFAKTAFDNDFTIRGATEVYLPVYCIVVQNPDNSILTTHWNALNGKRVQNSFVK